MPSQINNTTDILKISQSIRYQKKEYLVILYLDQVKNIQAIEEISYHHTKRIKINYLQLIQSAILYQSKALVLIHNHPSGDILPSPKDVLFTEKIRQLSDLAGIKLLDHVIVTEHSYFSFFEEGII